MQDVFPGFEQFQGNHPYNADMAKLGRPPKQEQNAFGKRIAKAREQAGLSQAELAKLIGVSQQVIGAWERKRNGIHSDNLIKLANALNTSTDALLGFKNNKTGNTTEKRLWRKFSQMEKLSAKDRKQVFDLMDSLIEKEELKKKVAS